MTEQHATNIEETNSLKDSLTASTILKSKVIDPEVTVPQDKAERQISSQPSLQMSDLIGGGVTSSKPSDKSTVATPRA